MILEGLMSVLFGLFDFVVGLIPSADPPAWMQNANGLFADIWAAGAGLGAWVPWALVGTVFSSVIVCIGIGFVIKVVRLVASYATAGGGAAG